MLFVILQAKKRASVVDQSAQSIVRYKIISMGEGGCGKSCLIKRYCEGKVRRRGSGECQDADNSVFEQFVERYISTIGIDFGVKPVTVQGTEVRVNFFDFSGHPEFFDVRNEFYKDTQGVRRRALAYCQAAHHAFPGCCRPFSCTTYHRAVVSTRSTRGWRKRPSSAPPISQSFCAETRWVLFEQAHDAIQGY